MAFNTLSFQALAQPTRLCTGFCTSTFDGLFNILGGQNTKRLPARAAVTGNACGAIAGAATYSKCAVPANHGSQQPRRRIYRFSPALRSPARQFIGAGHPHYSNIIIFYLTNTRQGINHYISRLSLINPVETRNSDGDTSVRGCNVSFNKYFIFSLRRGSFGPASRRTHHNNLSAAPLSTGTHALTICRQTSGRHDVFR